VSGNCRRSIMITRVLNGLELSVLLSQLPQGLLDQVHKLHTVFYWLG
jgi:hypothetical protein